jgi:hypothetical protein
MVSHLSPTQGRIKEVKRAFNQCLLGSVTKFAIFKNLSTNLGDTS